MKIIITILVVLLSLGGGAYYAQDSGLYDFSPLKEYIPSQVKELLNIEDEESVSVSSDDLEEVGEEMSNSYDGQLDTQEISQQNQSFDGQMPANNPDLQEAVSGNDEAEGIGSGIMGKLTGGLMQNLQKLAMNTTNTATDVAAIEATRKSSNDSPSPANNKVQELDASPEEMKMVNELNKIESTIVKLDSENEDLQDRYSKMLKANRELAIRIKEIDSKIKTIDE